MQQSQQRIQQLHHRLTRIQHFYYRSSPGPLSVMGWEGEGRGSVRVDAQKHGCLFYESGRFYPARGTIVDMVNCFEWECGDDHIRLSHRRRGEAVYLFDLVPEADGIWRSATPHHCGDDIYRGVLTLETEQISLQWRVIGPRKDEHFHYIYSETAISD